MNNAEFLDLSSKNNNNQVNNNNEKDEFEFQEGEFFNPGRKKMSDYKYLKKGNEADKDPILNHQEIGQKQQQNNYSRVNNGEEKIVWIGAIFVFFGVLVFLIGFWLGKTTIKEVAMTGKSYTQKIEEKLSQKKLENSMNASLNQTLDSLKNDSVSVPQTPVISSTPLVSQPVKEEVIDPIRTAPAVNYPKYEPKNIKLQTTKDVSKVNTIVARKTPIAATKSVKTTVNTIKGDFTIQVSAHTSMDKARFIEDNMRALNLNAYIVEANVNGITYYRVRVGKFNTKNDADIALARIKSSSFGKDSFVVNLN